MVGTIIAGTLLGLAAGTVAYAAVAFVANFALSYIVTRTFGMNKAPSQTDPGSRQQIPPAANNAIPVVYGDAWLGGSFVDAVLTTDNKTMYYVLVISNISANGQFTYDTTKFYYGDRLVTFDGTDPTKVASLTDGAGNVDTKIAGNLYINLYTSTLGGVITPVTGSAPNVVMGGVDIDAALRWPASGRQMNGLAFAIVKLNYNSEAGTTGLQPLTFKVSHDLNSTGVAKPGDVLLDYLTSTVYGCSIPLANVNTTACTALNTYSDQVITYIPYSGGSSSQPRYRINGVLNTGESVFNNIEKILVACDSWLAYQEATGQWSPIINKAEGASFAFDDSNIIGELRVSITDLSQSINEIEATFPWKENKDQTSVIYLETPSNLLYPNEPANKATITLDLVNDSIQGQYLCNRMLEQAREDLIVAFATAYPGIQVDAGDVITITNSAYGWNSKLFRVMRVSEVALDDGNLGANIECSEYNSQVYDDKNITEFTPAPNSDLNSSYYFSTLTAPTVSDLAPTAAVPSFSVTCNVPTTGRVTQISLFYTTSATPSATDWKLYGSAVLTDSSAFAPGLAFKFTFVTLPAGTYYLAYKVANDIASSILSPSSTALVWAPTGAQSAFLASFSPSGMSVPRVNGVASFTGQIARLYGTSGATAVDFVTSQTDSDVAFVNNTWRIGGSSTTGNGDIVTTGGLVMGSITDGGTYAQWGIPTAMTSSPATLTVPVRFKDSNGVITQAANAVLQWIFVDNGPTGPSGTQDATVYLYQWATAQPGNPSGTSTYTWATGANSTYTGGNGWSVTVPVNPGTPGIYLWIAAKQIVATAGTTTTTVSWTSGFTVYASTGNGVNGVKTAEAIVYRWATTIPTITGTSTYTWATDSVSSPPTNWFTTISDTGTAGQTLWAASVTLTDSVTATTTTVNWSTASILPFGYSGTTGAVARVAYTAASVTLNTTPQTITETGDVVPTTGSWGTGQVWTYTVPTLSAGQSVWQTDGIYNPTNNSTIWGLPYLSALKVGNLSAISTNTGSLTVSGSILVGNYGLIRGGQTAFDTGTGFFLGYSGTSPVGYKFSIGNSAGAKMTWNGTTLTLGGATNIDVTGTGSFGGSTAAASSQFTAVYGNGTNAGVHGVYGATNVAGVAGVRGDNTSTTASSYGLWGIAGGIGCRAQGTGTTAFGGYFTAQTLVNGFYASGGRIDQTGRLRWDDSSTPSTAGIGAYIETDSNNALYIISGASGSADPKAVIFGTKATSRARVDDAYIRPEVDNVITLGSGSFRYVDVYAVSGSVNTSDEREKNILGNNPLGLDFINRLETIQYKWKVAQGAVMNNIVDEDGNVVGQQEERPARAGVRTFHGLSAQQVKAALDDLGIDNFAGWVLANKDDPQSTQGLRYTEFIAPLIKAVQELSQKVTDLEAKLK